MSANPAFIKPELLEMMPTYKLVVDCYDGERKVKSVADYSIMAGASYNGGGYGHGLQLSPYLPDPSPVTDKDDARIRRYDNYRTRAVFFNVTKRTVKAMVGAIFSKYLTADLNELDYLETDVNGGGQSLTQQAKDATTICLLKGRGGLLADMPVNGIALTKADEKILNVRPIITNYDGEKIINWRVEKINGVLKNTLIVISESFVLEDDGFEQKLGEQLLILRLENNIATSEVMQKKDNGWQSVKKGIFKDYNGKPLNDIPFFPYGSVNNDLEPDDSPIADIAEINIAHFRDSADYQEALFIAGQPTLVLSGLTPEWIKDTLGGTVSIGSRMGVMLPEGGNAFMLQAQPNSALMESMIHKEKQMTALGAKLIEGSKQTKTATEAAQDSAEESNTLTNIAYNISDAYTKALKACARYMGYKEDGLVVALNTTFNFSKMTPEQRMQLMAEWQMGAITWGEMRAQLVESEVATIEDENEAEQIIKSEQGAITTQERILSNRFNRKNIENE